MANKFRGECELVLAGKTYILRPTFEALVEFEEKSGTTAYEAMKGMSERHSAPAKAMRAAFLAGMRAVPKQVVPTADELGRMMQDAGLANVLPIYMTFLGNALSSTDDLERAAADSKDGVQGEATT